MYSHDQLLEMIEKGVPDSATKIILNQLVNNSQTAVVRELVIKNPDNKLDVIEPNDVRLKFNDSTDFGFEVYTGPGEENRQLYQPLNILN